MYAYICIYTERQTETEAEKERITFLNELQC